MQELRSVAHIPTQSVRLCDELGKTMASFEVENGVCELPIYNDMLFYKAKNARFYVYDGEGELDFRECRERFSFEGSSDELVEALDTYLQTRQFPKHTSELHKKRINDFVKLANLNIQKNADYIAPPSFKELESALYQE